MDSGLAGAIVGLLLAIADYALLAALARRVELDETKRVLKITGLSQFVLLPFIGYVIAPYLAGE
jgi:preprotein translocase subunit Sss1